MSLSNIHPELKSFFENNIEVNGFSRAMLEIFDPNDWIEVPYDIKIHWQGLISAQLALKTALSKYGIDPH